ncbi:MAG: hypothetical protein RSF40_01230 [Oscillospiraceae bacterium]
MLFLLNTYITTGISDKKINKSLEYVAEDSLKNSFTSFKELLDYLVEHNTGKDSDILLCQCYISAFDDNDIKNFIKSIITKSLKIGIDAKTVNKIYGKDFIPTWEVQLGSGFDKLKLKPNEYFYLSQKLNGNRCSFVDGKLTSRQGKEFTGLQHIIDDINRLGLQDFFIDGELVRKNTDSVSDGENFRIGTGIINSDDADKDSIKFVVFDFFHTSELINKESENSYSRRKELLLRLKRNIEGNHLENIDVVEMVYEGADKSQIDEWLEYAVNNNWEGLMLNKDTTYKCKRTTDLIKVKRFYTMDLKVVAVEEGSGRLQGTLGALVVEYKGNTVNVGSGYDDKTRSEIWSNRENIIGKIIEVKYKETTSDKNTGLESLQFPIFVRIRNDKDEPSYN